MGKLGDLWAELKETNNQERIKELQGKINSIESWCIENNYAGIKELTDWRKWSERKTKKTYRFEGGRDGGLYRPHRAKTGKDRCGCCIFNKRVYCDPDDNEGHFANI